MLQQYLNEQKDSVSKIIDQELISIIQRPANVSKGVVSQCSIQAIFRTISNNDLDQIREVVEGVSEAEVSQLPHFETGQAYLQEWGSGSR